MRKKHTPEGGGSDWSAAPSGRITPMDVQQKEFSVARFGGGYRMREVDEFLDQVTDALSALTAENERLLGGGPAPASSVDPTPRPVADEDRAAVVAFLQREKGFLQSLGGLVQGHAEELKRMVRESRREPAATPVPAPAPAPEAVPSTPSAERPDEPEAIAAPATDVDDSSGPIVVEDEVDQAVLEEEGADSRDESPGATAASEAAPPGSGSEQPIHLDEPAPARSRRGEDEREGSLRELFWGEE